MAKLSSRRMRFCSGVQGMATRCFFCEALVVPLDQQESKRSAILGDDGTHLGGALFLLGTLRLHVSGSSAAGV